MLLFFCFDFFVDDCLTLWNEVFINTLASVVIPAGINLIPIIVLNDKAIDISSVILVKRINFTLKAF